MFRIDLGFPVIVMIGVVLCLISIFDRVTKLAWMSYTGLGGVICIDGAILYTLWTQGVAKNMSNPALISTVDTILHADGGYLDRIGVNSTLTFALCNQYGVPQAIADLKDKSPQNIGIVAVWASLIPVAVYLVSGICGYLIFGLEIEENIPKNFAPMILEGNVIPVARRPILSALSKLTAYVSPR
jgi:amino acid permease